MMLSLLFIVAIVFASILFYKFGKEDGLIRGKEIGYSDGYAKAILDRIKEL